MKYLTSQIIDRSKRLADIANTSFLTYEELEQYLQDSWTGVYQTMINKGIKAFTKEVELVNAGSAVGDWTEYEIPEDLFQICSLKNKISGSIVPRYAESESINSGSYEVVNNKIRLYGVVASPLLLTYWVVPTFLSFPDKDVEVGLNGTVISSAGNSVLYDTGAIVNVKNGETLGSVEIKEGYNYQLGNGHVVEHGELETDTDTWTIGSQLLDKDLNEINVPQGTPDTPTTISEDVYYYDNKYYYAPDKAVDATQYLIEAGDSGYYTTTQQSANIYNIQTTSPVRTDGYNLITKSLIWDSAMNSDQFKVIVPNMTFGMFTATIDGETNYIMMADTDNSEYPNEPQFVTSSVYAGNDDPFDAYSDTTLYTTTTSTITAPTNTSFVYAYDSDLMALTVLYKDSVDNYYYMKDWRLGAVAGNIVQCSTPSTIGATFTSYTMYNISTSVPFIYGRDASKYYKVMLPNCEIYSYTSYYRITSPTVINEMTASGGIEWFYYFMGNTTSRLSGFENWDFITQRFYSSMYEITGLTPTAIETEEVTDETLKYNIYIDTDELSVNYSIYRYYYRGLNYKDYNDNVIFSDDTAGSYSTFLDSEYNVNYQVLEDGEYSTPKLFGTELFEMSEDEVIPRFVAAHEGLFLFSTQVDGNNVLTGYVPELESYIDECPLDYTPSAIIPVDRFNMERAFLVRTSGNKYRLWHFTDDDYAFTDDRVDIKAPINITLLRYGPLVSNGTNATIKSRIPDTLLDFPNDFFFSIIAVDLAMRFAMKQNADASGLQAQYDTMWFTYMNTLEQDSGYSRIISVYN